MFRQFVAAWRGVNWGSKVDCSGSLLVSTRVAVCLEIASRFRSAAQMSRKRWTPQPHLQKSGQFCTIFFFYNSFLVPSSYPCFRFESNIHVAWIDKGESEKQQIWWENEISTRRSKCVRNLILQQHTNAFRECFRNHLTHQANVFWTCFIFGFSVERASVWRRGRELSSSVFSGSACKFSVIAKKFGNFGLWTLYNENRSTICQRFLRWNSRNRKFTKSVLRIYLKCHCWNFPEMPSKTFWLHYWLSSFVRSGISDHATVRALLVGRLSWFHAPRFLYAVHMDREKQ